MTVYECHPDCRQCSYVQRLELTINQLQPVIAQVKEKATKLRQAKKLPQYVSQRVDNLLMQNDSTIERLLQGVRSIRGTLPQVERNHRHKLPRLRVGSRYKIVLGGAFLTAPDTEWQYYFREKSKNLYLGDIIKYRGQYVLEGSRNGTKSLDIFEIDGFIGAFKPISEKGRANLNYLVKAR